MAGQFESSVSVIVLEETRVTPQFNSADTPTTTEFSLPLTFFDATMLKRDPPQHIFYYKLTESPPSFFNSVIVPRLKHSLSLTLRHFLPAAGKLTWPLHSTQPFILYTRNDDDIGVLLTIAESNANFHRLTHANNILEAAELDPYIPELQPSSTVITESKGLALKITNFPEQGFCIGTSIHHSMFDAKTFSMFLNAWAHISKLQAQILTIQQLPPELIPCYDRSPILCQDYRSEGTDVVGIINDWFSDKNKDRPGLDITPRSLKLPVRKPRVENGVVRGIFELSDRDISMLRQKVAGIVGPQCYLSTFVLVVAYTMAQVVKARAMESDREVFIRFAADFRGEQSRLEPPISSNYFGNCVGLCKTKSLKAGEIVKGDWNGVSAVAKRLKEEIKVLKDGGGLERAKQNFKTSFFTELSKSLVMLRVSGTLKVGFYGLDFGWGTPHRVECTHIQQTGNVYLGESKNGSGGVEVNIAMNKQVMDVFSSSFKNFFQEPFIDDHQQQLGLTGRAKNMLSSLL